MLLSFFPSTGQCSALLHLVSLLYPSQQHNFELKRKLKKEKEKRKSNLFCVKHSQAWVTPNSFLTCVKSQREMGLKVLLCTNGTCCGNSSFFLFLFCCRFVGMLLFFLIEICQSITDVFTHASCCVLAYRSLFLQDTISKDISKL